MKAKDLMLGDWVLVQGKPSKVIEIREHSVLLQGRSFCVYENELEPIPLTTEMLEKNGFVKEEFKESPYVDWYKLVYSAYPNKETELVEVNIVKENNEIVGIACAKMMHTNQRLFRIEKYREMNIYVHELQNALRLTGIEKEVAL